MFLCLYVYLDLLVLFLLHYCPGSVIRFCFENFTLKLDDTEEPDFIHLGHATLY